MIKALITLAFVLSITSCGVDDGLNGLNGLNGIDGLDGSDGLNYYSYLEPASLQEIVGDGIDERFEAPEADYYQLPSEIELNVDNPYSEEDCKVRPVNIIFETDKEKLVFKFVKGNNRYLLRLVEGPMNLVVDTSKLIVYYESIPEVDCGDTIYKMHSGLSFNIRIIKKLVMEEEE